MTTPHKIHVPLPQRRAPAPTKAERKARLRAQRDGMIDIRNPLYDPRITDGTTFYFIRVSSRKLVDSEYNRGKQEDSPEVQREMLDRYCEQRGYAKPESDDFVFVERMSGTWFEVRDVFNQMKATCQANRIQNGTVVCVDMDRFSRELDEYEDADVFKVMEVFREFRDAGWHVDFVTTPLARKAGITEYFMLAMKAFMSGEFARIAGMRQRKARVKTAERGHFLCGRPPFPAIRVDALTERELLDGEWSPNGSVLKRTPVEAYYRSWEWAMERLAEGWSCKRVAAEGRRLRLPLPGDLKRLDENGKPVKERRIKWNHAAVRRWATNTQLIGQPTYNLRDKGGATPVEAKWKPVVDVKKFLAANARLAEVAETGRRRGRGQLVGEYLLEMYCQACGAPYYPHDWKYQGALRARYIHRNVSDGVGSEEWMDKAQACGCRAWTVDAPMAHEELRRLIEKHRTSEDFVSDMLRMRRAAGDRLNAALTHEQQCKAAHEAAERDLSDFLTNLGNIKSKSILARLDEITEQKEQAVEEARLAWEQARRQTMLVSEEPSDLRERINFTKQVLKVWESAPVEAKREVFSYWIDSILVKPGKRSGRRGPNDEVVLLVNLRSDPEKTLALRFGGPGASPSGPFKRGNGRREDLAALSQKDGSSRRLCLVQQYEVHIKVA